MNPNQGPHSPRCRMRALPSARVENSPANVEREIIQTAKTYNFRGSHLPRERSYRRTCARACKREGEREREKDGERRNIIDTIGKYRNTVPAGEYRGDQFRGIHINFRCVVDPPCETAVRFLLLLLLLRLASRSSVLLGAPLAPLRVLARRNARRSPTCTGRKSPLSTSAASVPRENLPIPGSPEDFN